MIGLTAAFLITGAVENGAAEARASGLADAAAHGFSESALRSRGLAMTPGALAIAQRHDPISATDTVFGAQRADQADKLATRLEAKIQARATLRPSERLIPAARPFQASGALAGAREMECLTQAVYYEARGETPSGQAAVAQVVLNRVRHPAFPKSVCGVVFQGAQVGRSCQFSFACDGSLRRTRESGAWRRAQSVASRALGGFVMADVGNATHFHAARIGPQWGSMVRVSQVGLHVFYRFGGRGGAPATFRQPKPVREAPQTVYASLAPTLEAPPFLRVPQPDKVEAPAKAAAPVEAAKAAEAAVEPTAGPAAANATQATVSAS